MENPDPQMLCSCTKVILPCREPLKQGTVEGPSGVRFFPRVAWWTSQWLFLTCHTGGQSASPDQWSQRACHRCWARWPKAPWPPRRNPCGEIGCERDSTAALQPNSSVSTAIPGMWQCPGKQEGSSGANLFPANSTTLSCTPNSLCWFRISHRLKEAVKFPDKSRTGWDSQLM